MAVYIKISLRQLSKQYQNSIAHEQMISINANVINTKKFCQW